MPAKELSPKKKSYGFHLTKEVDVTLQSLALTQRTSMSKIVENSIINVRDNGLTEEERARFEKIRPLL